MPPAAADPRRQAIFFLSLTAVTAGVAARCMEAILPQLASDFGASISAAAVVVSAFGVGYTVAVILHGPLGDRYGKLRVVTLCTAGAGLASLACAWSWDLASLSVLRFFVGAFAAAAVPLGMAYIGDVVPIEERQPMIARFVAGSLLGQALGPLAGGLFADWFTWRAAFVTLGAVFLAASATLGVRTWRDWPRKSEGPFRPFRQQRELLGRSPVRWILLTGVAETTFFFGAYTFLGAYFKLRFDLPFTWIGVLLAGFGFGGILYSISVRWLLRTLGDRGMILGGGIICAVLFGLVLVVPHWTLALPCTVGLGVGFYMIHNAMQTRSTEVAPDARGAAVALYAAAFIFGQALGAAVVGAAVAVVGYEPMILLGGLGILALGIWLRSNLWRFRP